MQLSWTLKISGVALAAMLSACGEVKGTGTDGGGSGSGENDFTLTVDPASLSIPIAGSATVTVNVTRTGTVGEIVLTAEGLGASLTADLPPIAADASNGQVTINVAGGSLPAASTVTITGTAAGKTHSATVEVTTKTITVTGTVRGGRSGVKVGIIGKQSVTSGAGGVFTFTDVTPPYDLYTFAMSGCGNTMTPTVYFFDDLTRADPTVTAATYASTCFGFVFCLFPNPSSAVSGTKSGTGNNTDPVVWAWSEGSFGSPTLATNGAFSGTASWCSGNTSTGSLYALQLTRKANGAPDTFLGFAKSPTVTYTSGQGATTNLTFGAVGSSGTITGTLNGPTGYPTPSVDLYQGFGNTNGLLWQATTTAIDAAFPIIASAGGNSLYATTTLAGTGTSSYVQPLTATATVNFTMPVPAVLGAPAAAATGVTTSTPITWTASGVISQLNVSGAGAVYRIYTTKGEATIPVVPELALPGGTAFNWNVTGYAPVTSINDAAGTTELESVSALDFTGPAHAITTTVTRSFTTQ